MLYRVTVNDYKGQRIVVDLCNTEEQFRKLTVQDLKEKILQKLPPQVELGRICLIFADERLDDDKLLTDYGIQHESVIQIVLRADGGGGPIPEEGNMGDRDQKNRSMERLGEFKDPPLWPKQ